MGRGIKAKKSKRQLVVTDSMIKDAEKELEAYKERLTNEICTRIETDVNKTIDRARINTILIALLIMHDKYGFGKKRLQDLLGLIQEMEQDVNMGRLQIEDIELVLKNETEIEVE